MYGFTHRRVGNSANVDICEENILSITNKEAPEGGLPDGYI